MSGESANAISIEHGVLLSDIPEDKPLLAKFHGDEFLIVKQGSIYHAVGAKCSHEGAPLIQGLIEDGQIRCPWHHARFCLKTGAAVAAPALEPLQLLETEIRGDRLIVREAPEEPPRAKAAEPRRVVIIGAGAAGYACADMLVKHGFNGMLTVINADPDAPYDRPSCSKDYLAGKKKRSDCFLSNNDLFAETKGAEQRVSLVREKATSLDLDSKSVLLDSSRRIGFDILVLAQGAEPKQSIPGLDAAQMHVLRTLRDADRIIDLAGKSSSVAIVGASFIGLEAAAALRERKLEVHVVAPDDVPLSKSVGVKTGSMIRAVHEKKGVIFHFGRELKTYADKKVTLDDSSSFRADFIILGAGVEPRTRLAEEAGLAVASAEKGGGVVVDHRLETSVPGIFAVGDIARYPNHVTGAPIRVEHWVHAQRQGQFVARTILGEVDTFEDIPFFWSAHFDTSLRYVGHVENAQNGSLEGSMDNQDFSITFSDEMGGKALLTCEQDLKSLRIEAEWERQSR